MSETLNPNNPEGMTDRDREMMQPNEEVPKHEVKVTLPPELFEKKRKKGELPEYTGFTDEMIAAVKERAEKDQRQQTIPVDEERRSGSDRRKPEDFNPDLEAYIHEHGDIRPPQK